MKNTGIVRRLDELGRIVIPREFRKTHRINVGDPLEISATESGDIIISKVDNTSDLVALCQTVCASLGAELNLTVVASNFERVLTGFGAGKQSLIERELPANLIKMLKNRGIYNGPIESSDLGRTFDLRQGYIAIAPLLSLDDCFGGLFAFSEHPISVLDAAGIKLAGRLVGDALGHY